MGELGQFFDEEMSMRSALFGMCTLLAVLMLSCGGKPKGDVIVPLSGSVPGNKPSSSGDAGAAGTQSDGKSDGTTPTGGTCKPAFSFADAQQRCASCHSSAGGNPRWSKADGTEADWKSFAAEIRASVDADRMPMPKFDPADKEKFIAFIDGLTGSCTPADSTAGGGGLPPADPNIMSLAEAKVQCAGCHMPGAQGAKWWDKADGTEEEWRAAAPALLAAVEKGISSNATMPPAGFTGNNKVRFVNFIKKLRENESNVPISYSLQTAKPLCVGCHNQSRAAEGVNLELMTTWRNNGDVAKEIDDGKMPENFGLNPQEKSALLNFISNL
jgi:mono/diheme cytochrome c family protein